MPPPTRGSRHDARLIVVVDVKSGYAQNVVPKHLINSTRAPKQVEVFCYGYANGDCPIYNASRCLVSLKTFMACLARSSQTYSSSTRKFLLPQSMLQVADIIHQRQQTLPNGCTFRARKPFCCSCPGPCDGALGQRNTSTGNAAATNA